MLWGGFEKNAYWYIDYEILIHKDQTESRHQSLVLNQQGIFSLSWIEKKINMKCKSRRMWIGKRLSRLFKKRWVRTRWKVLRHAQVQNRNGHSKRLAKILSFWNCFLVKYQIPILVWVTKRRGLYFGRSNYFLCPSHSWGFWKASPKCINVNVRIFKVCPTTVVTNLPLWIVHFILQTPSLGRDTLENKVSFHSVSIK